MQLKAVIAFLGLCATGVQAQQPAPPPTAPPSTSALAHKAPQPPAIDGRNSDAVWQTAPRVTEFRQFAPRENTDPSFRTEFQVAFDEHNVFVFVRAYDPHPDS